MLIVGSWRWLLAALVAAIALTGCGTGADRARVREVTAGFFSAHDAYRGAEACRRLSAALAQSIEQEHAMSPCAAAVLKIKVRGSATAVVHVYATSARADLASGESVFLGLMRDGWRIDALGCRPRASGPYDCQEQG
jgi:tellurite resistance protein